MTARTHGGRLPASFRDPSGFLFERDGTLFRAVDERFAGDFTAFTESGFYERACAEGLLVEHDEVDAGLAPTPAWKVVRPRRLPFISYPYEWCPGQRRDAALLTLRLQELALEHGLVMRDASAYNVQFDRSRPILIDTLSFGRRVDDEPWVAYGQFCRHFLAPLALEALVDVRLADLLVTHIDGIPLDLASGLLPARSRLKPGLLQHLHMHASSRARREADPERSGSGARFSLRALQGVVESLRSTIEHLRWEPSRTTWRDYYAEAGHYTEEAMAAKMAAVQRLIAPLAPRLVFDLGANTGRFSRVAAAGGADVVALDVDPGAVEVAWRQLAEEPVAGGSVLPLRYDLANPSPAIGWANTERMDLKGRGPADVVLALALVHHLAIGGNVPLDRVLAHLTALGRHLIVEWVPKHDPKVRVLLATREDVFDRYTQEDFEAAAAEHADVLERVAIAGSDRILYLLRAR